MTYSTGVPKPTLTPDEINTVQRAAHNDAGQRATISLTDLDAVCETARQAQTSVGRFVDESRRLLDEASAERAKRLEAEETTRRSRAAEEQWKAEARKHESLQRTFQGHIEKINEALLRATNGRRGPGVPTLMWELVDHIAKERDEATTKAVEQVRVEVVDLVDRAQKAEADLRQTKAELARAQADVATVKKERDEAWDKLNLRLHNENAVEQQGDIAYLQAYAINYPDPRTLFPYGRIKLEFACYKRAGAFVQRTCPTNVKLTVALDDPGFRALACEWLGSPDKKLQKENAELHLRNGELQMKLDRQGNELGALRKHARAIAETLK
jgi:hypothetical protein